jgi:hypothetical protein
LTVQDCQLQQTSGSSPNDSTHHGKFKQVACCMMALAITPFSNKIIKNDEIM